MVASHLVVGATVRRPQVDVLELAIAQPEGDADEPAGGSARARRRLPRELEVDGPVPKLSSFDDRVSFAVGNVAVLGNFNGALALVFHRFQPYAVRCQLI